MSATPKLSSAVTQIIVNPTWTVPKSIQKDLIARKIKRDPDYLEKNGYEVGKTSGGSARLRQKPGRKNALGQFKFYFDNTQVVYLHDTPRRGLFSKPVRAFSYGCVRVENPRALAEALLAHDREWSSEEASDFVGHQMRWGKEQKIDLETSVPIHLEYITAEVDEAGRVRFFGDIYHYHAD